MAFELIEERLRLEHHPVCRRIGQIMQNGSNIVLVADGPGGIQVVGCPVVIENRHGNSMHGRLKNRCGGGRDDRIHTRKLCLQLVALVHLNELIRHPELLRHRSRESPCGFKSRSAIL